MGFWGRLFGYDTYDAAQRVLTEPFEPFVGAGGIPVADPGLSLPAVTGNRAAVEWFWRTQPNVRKVVDFIARNVASVPLHVHERVSDTDRRRVTTGPLADLMATPRPRMGAYRFWHSVLSDGLLYDRWALIRQTLGDGSQALVQVPSWRLRFDTDPLRQVTAAWFWVGTETAREPGDRNGWRPLDLDSLVFDHGYAPRSAGLSPIDTLRDMLEETAEAVAYRRQVWENGGRVTKWIERPAGVSWTPEQRDRFGNHFRNTYTGRGENAGGVPILEDGMQLHDAADFKPQDTGDLEGRRLSGIEVAAAFHIAPELVGAQQGNYSNVREYRQMLYRDSLGPYIKAVEDALNAQLTPDLSDGRKLYVEANVEAKLRGDFIEQAQVKQSATGAPWLTRNEARAMENRPPVPGGDQLVTPLNVLVGGQSSPNDSGSQNRRSGPVRVKARAEAWDKKAQQVLVDFFARQEKAVRSRLGAKSPDWWDEERWDSELSDDIFRLAVAVSSEIGPKAAERLGFTPDDYDTDRTLAFLRAVSDSHAKSINAATRYQLEDALGSDEPSDGVDSVWNVAQGQRSVAAAGTLVTAASGFATTEAARQVSGGRATKTWVTGPNPRSSHAAMDGETVGIEEKFSNGMNWPGDGGDVDEIAGCNCEVIVDVPEEGD